MENLTTEQEFAIASIRQNAEHASREQITQLLIDAYLLESRRSKFLKEQFNMSLDSPPAVDQESIAKLEATFRNQFGYLDRRISATEARLEGKLAELEGKAIADLDAHARDGFRVSLLAAIGLVVAAVIWKWVG